MGSETKTTTEHHETVIKKTGTGATASPEDHKLPENSHENLDEKLDSAMDETFPGSDPVSIKITK